LSIEERKVEQKRLYIHWEGALGLEEDDWGSTCREGELSFAEKDVCVRDFLFYQRAVLGDVCIVPKQSFVTA
jgi:hypothetical protein